jgi:hypothetical protein
MTIQPSRLQPVIDWVSIRLLGRRVLTAIEQELREEGFKWVETGYRRAAPLCPVHTSGIFKCRTWRRVNTQGGIRHGQTLYTCHQCGRLIPEEPEGERFVFPQPL